MPSETCATCGFRATEYGVRDAVGTVKAAATRWRQLTGGLDDDVLAARQPGTWSAADHAARARDETAAMGDLLAAMLEPVPPAVALSLPEPDPDGPVEPLPTVIAGLDDAAVRIVKLARSFRGAGWRRGGLLDGREVDAAWALRHAVHAVEHSLHHGGRAIRLAGAGAPTTTGTVAQLNVSDGGVPKRPVTEVAVGRRGLQGDRQAERQHHGRPWQALSLWSLERVETLQAEGHPIQAGAAGENVTVAGVDWAIVRPGVRLQMGDVVAQVSAYAIPCKKNARWFTDGDFRRIHHERHPGWSRVYASVVRGGTVRAGDAVVVEP